MIYLSDNSTMKSIVKLIQDFDFQPINKTCSLLTLLLNARN